MPRPGDKVSILDLEWPENFAGFPGVDGRDSLRNVVMDLSRCAWHDSGRFQTIEPGSYSVSFVRTRNGMKSYFRVCGDTVFHTGYETRILNLRDSAGFCHMVFPREDGSQASALFRLNGTYSHDRAAARYGMAETFTGRMKGLILPTGDTISDIRYVLSRTRANSDVSIRPDNLIDAYSDSVPFDVVATMELYAEGYRYPLVELQQKSSYYRNAFLRTETGAVMIPPHEQTYSLREDPYNEDIRRRIEEENNERRILSEDGDDDKDDDDDAPLKDVRCVVEGGTLHLSFDSSVGAGFLSLVISDISGIPRKTIPRVPIREGLNTLDIDCSSLAPQEYAMFLEFGDVVMNLKFTLR